MELKRLICLALAAVTVLPLYACAQSENTGQEPAGQEPVSEAPAAEAETEAPETEPEYPPLPEADLDGFTLRISNMEPSSMSWANIAILTEQDGTPVNDAIYQRNAELEETYNCVLEETLQADRNTGYITSAVAAGSDDYDVCMVYDISAAEVVGSMLDWNLLSGPDYTRPWWNPDATGMFAIDGKLYYTAGNMTLGYLSRAMCYLVNRRLYENLGFEEDLYELVRSGQWTQDRFLDMAARGVMDTDGDGRFTDRDTYGVFGNPRAFLNTLMGGAGLSYVERDETGSFVFRMSENEAAVNLIQNAVRFMSVHPDLYYNKGTAPSDLNPDTLFAAGQALFHVQGLPHTIAQLREMEDDFGILPLPKLDEIQSGYFAPSYGAALTGIPKTVPADRYDSLGLLLEAMTRRTQEAVVPQYKEVLLTNKLTRDEASADMLDIIFGSIVFDPGVVLWCGNISDKICADLFMKRNDAVVSYLEKNTPAFQKLIDAFNAAVS